ncbi:LexA/Signal peptidase [Ascobolus immersus RN42]|uniref:Mitochondrial inner membrane protease subunit 2 n=1 Tax=Ascobolus immersus RN42 TaxID=1160509 RepID=A0A3N4IIH7_ASCIM|nr:LexA/Signal peptidase [Ascobolus immersus RN42]
MPPKLAFLKPVSNVLLSLPIAIFLTNTFYSPAWVTGPSMSPTLSTRADTSSPSSDKRTQRDLVLLSHFNAHNEASRGEIISFISPLDPERVLVKRVVGVEGDLLLEGRRGRVVEVPKGYVWVEGDGRRWSRDSREFGPVSRGLITGRVAGILYPFNRMGKVEEYEGWRRNLVSRVEERRLRMRFE